MSHPQVAVPSAPTGETGGDYPTIDPYSIKVPSDTVAPTRTDSSPQQASTQPGDGGKQHDKREWKVPWKDQVLGYAKVTRGKVLGNEETKGMGHKILQGDVEPIETHKH